MAPDHPIGDTGISQVWMALLSAEGYAHALFRRGCPVPVDSGLERSTLEVSQRRFRWLAKRMTTGAEAGSRDIEVDVEGATVRVADLLPDLIRLTPAANALYQAHMRTWHMKQAFFRRTDHQYAP
jgi:hypothetical protein